MFKALSVGLQNIYSYRQIGTARRLGDYGPTQFSTQFTHSPRPFRLIASDVAQLFTGEAESEAS